MASNRPLSDAELTRYRDAVPVLGAAAKAAKALGISSSTLKSRIDMATARGIKPKAVAVDLHKRIHQLEKDLKAATREQADTQAIKECIGTAWMHFDKLEAPAWVVKAKSADCPGVPTLQLSDFHWGERVYPKQVNNVNEFTV